MYYWNESNFKGLKEVGMEFQHRPGFTFFADYCLSKEKGLKKQAKQSIGAFVDMIDESDVYTQRNIVVCLLELKFENPAIHQLLPHPLRMKLISILDTWSQSQEVEGQVFRWLGYLLPDAKQYDKAIELDPQDQIALGMRANSHLNSVDYQTHHLSESRFLGEVSEAESTLVFAESLISRLEAGRWKKRLSDELDYYKRLIKKWKEYCELSPTNPFPKWCERQGELFEFCSIHYYGE